MRKSVAPVLLLACGAAAAAAPVPPLTEADYRQLAALIAPREIVAYPKLFTVFIRFEGAPMEAVVAQLQSVYPRPMAVKPAGVEDRWDDLLGCSMDRGTQTLAAVITIHAPVWQGAGTAVFKVDSIPCEISVRHDIFTLHKDPGGWQLLSQTPQPDASAAPAASTASVSPEKR